ncbi:uncharacterized protein G2W53_004397 [Senna tora]|uniref:Uncharacterized protein n=1 Tax=Senna tora TaxID=362788 RepID=A0A835CHY9_9FABA|nr:uncharacterized protein G2W53_004384 [Senna tora]KAF7842099.1 uncharacterized protein G2W53_004397 [Senna tora]
MAVKERKMVVELKQQLMDEEKHENG